MRCTPMAVYTAGLKNIDEKKAAIIGDVSMTHPDKNIHNCVCAY